VIQIYRKNPFTICRVLLYCLGRTLLGSTYLMNSDPVPVLRVFGVNDTADSYTTLRKFYIRFARTGRVNWKKNRGSKTSYQCSSVSLPCNGVMQRIMNVPFLKNKIPNLLHKNIRRTYKTSPYKTSIHTTSP
jgi:hypothetical protein